MTDSGMFYAMNQGLIAEAENLDVQIKAVQADIAQWDQDAVDIANRAVAARLEALSRLIQHEAYKRIVAKMSGLDSEVINETHSEVLDQRIDKALGNNSVWMKTLVEGDFEKYDQTDVSKQLKTNRHNILKNTKYKKVIK